MEETRYKKLVERIKKIIEYRYQHTLPLGVYILMAKEYKKACKESFSEIDRLKKELKEREEELKKYKKSDIESEFVVDDEDSDVEIERAVEEMSGDLIENLINRYLPQTELEELIERVVQLLLRSNFNLNRIDLRFFEEHKISSLQKGLFQEVQKRISGQDQVVIGKVTNRIIKSNFQYIHQLFAEEVLEAANVNRGVFKFFDGFFVEDKEGNRWSTYAITRFMREYVSVREAIKSENMNLEKCETKMGELRERDVDLWKRVSEAKSGKYSEEERSGLREKIKAERTELKESVKKVERSIRHSQTALVEKEFSFKRADKEYTLLLDGVTNALIHTKAIHLHKN
jgi:hypothetical protein